MSVTYSCLLIIRRKTEVHNSILNMLLGKFTSLVQVLLVGTLRSATVDSLGVEQRIYSGSATTKEQFPFMVLIDFDVFDPAGKLNYEESGSCSGFVISARWILTASHCLGLPHLYQKYNHLGDGRFDNYTTKYRIITDLIEANGHHPKNKENAAVIDTDKVYAHDKAIEFDGGNDTYGTYIFDVALLNLDKPLTMSATTQSIPLMGTKLPRFVDHCLAVGFGLTQPVFDDNRTLNFISVRAGGERYCETLSDSGGFQEQGLCVQGVDSLTSPCSGDSGSPLVCSGHRGYVAAGVASGVLPRKRDNYTCGGEVKYTLYTSTSSLSYWIANVTQDQGVEFVTWISKQTSEPKKT